jgi:hypothetical protein
MIPEIKDILNKIDSIKSTLDGYRPFSDHVVSNKRSARIVKEKAIENIEVNE